MRPAGRARRAAVLLAVLPVLAMAGCSQSHDDERGKGDAPVLGGRGEDSPAQVLNMPDGFGNLATKCVGPGQRGYSTTRWFGKDDDGNDITLPAQTAVVPDPDCR
ncbi:hypothetical protein LO771_14115 [Streptacidiphilus sp. ASG 303]|uniref:hypothetical protein n=1 Tax=Streptacidiphilus sp. ASG 303 TaxID=2896847 RepID=UPI001E345848|nr:hypothetical protein [Streptacidiphilus sp. ASG 303]MCD0483505.1 hypothetical protein [Streptacidiphilus sp. ASG 303]